MTSRQWTGEDSRDSLTQRHPDAKARMLPSCAACGLVVYRVTRTVARGGVLCGDCAQTSCPTCGVTIGERCLWWCDCAGCLRRDEEAVDEHERYMAEMAAQDRDA